MQQCVETPKQANTPQLFILSHINIGIKHNRFTQSINFTLPPANIDRGTAKIATQSTVQAMR